jgi:hypothetical protein
VGRRGEKRITHNDNKLRSSLRASTSHPSPPFSFSAAPSSKTLPLRYLIPPTSSLLLTLSGIVLKISHTSFL